MKINKKITDKMQYLLKVILLIYSVNIHFCDARSLDFITSNIFGQIDFETGVFQHISLREKRFSGVDLLSQEVKEAHENTGFFQIEIVNSGLNTELMLGSSDIVEKDGQIAISTKIPVKSKEEIIANLIKTMVFYPETYVFDLNIQIENIGEEPLNNLSILLKFGPGITNNLFENTLFLKDGQNIIRFPYAKTIPEKKIYNESFDIIGIMTNYYALIIKPEDGVERYSFSIKSLENKKAGHQLSKAGEGNLDIRCYQQINSGESKDFSFKIFLGPMIQEELEKIGATGIVDMGFFGGIAEILLMIMRWFYLITGNWGFSIILLTIMVRIILHPLNVKQVNSMKQMNIIQPQVNAMREKYKTDPQKMNQEVMKLYKEHNINPLGGCLPMLFQIPVLFALFNVLRTNVELKGISFLWIKDLAMPEVIVFGGNEFNFPLLALLISITMWWQQKSMSGGSPEQQQMMWFMPIFMFFITKSIAAGVLVYWLISTLLSIISQKPTNMLPRKEGVKANQAK